MEQWVELIANLGFPIAVSMYLLTRVEDKIDNFTYLVLDLISLIEKAESKAQDDKDKYL